MLLYDDTKITVTSAVCILSIYHTFLTGSEQTSAWLAYLGPGLSATVNIPDAAHACFSIEQSLQI